MTRLWNFSAGPAALPEVVLRQAQQEMLDWQGAGCSVMEMSHRGKEFMSILHQAEADLRELLAIPANYKVLFLQGGATLQFSQIPMNLLGNGAADYVVTGSWSKKAYKEAQRLFGAERIRCAASTESDQFCRFPEVDEIKLNADAAYLHVCTNETIHGVEVRDLAALPATAVPLVADLSSHILSAPIDVSRYGLIYAGAQKNIGPSGLTLVIVRDDLIGKASATTPAVMDYAVMAENGSMLNTPPTFGIYIAGLIFQWLKHQGGLVEIEKVNRAKAELLYGCIDASNGFYRNPVQVQWRSWMNVPFTLANPELDAAFLSDAKAAGLLGLKGHKSVGGMRASIYNAIPLAGVQALVCFMNDFANKHG
ncbi:MAG TPA: 3-phosphoserine/phosphohydroxythreonine transaminase [Rhodocyclaceae bacterium]|nr:3-phosphoserine/phosphohydroxythreonine transaminase [Rhodocyclaceae bacterium]